MFRICVVYVAFIGNWIITDQLYVCICYKHANMHRVTIAYLVVLD